MTRSLSHPLHLLTIVRRVVRMMSWTTVVGAPVMGARVAWPALEYWLFDVTEHSYWGGTPNMLETVVPALVVTAAGMGLGGACLLIADVHERQQ